MTTSLASTTDQPHTYTPRIPKLKVRNPGPAFQPEGPSSSNTPSTLLPNQRPDNITSRRPSQTASSKPSSYFAGGKDGGATRGVLGYLTIKEPSQHAWQSYAKEQRKQAGVKGMGVTGSGFTGPSQRKLPSSVPKVNSKWNGMPDNVVQRGGRGIPERQTVDTATKKRESPRDSLLDSPRASPTAASDGSSRSTTSKTSARSLPSPSISTRVSSEAAGQHGRSRSKPSYQFPTRLAAKGAAPAPAQRLGPLAIPISAGSKAIGKAASPVSPASRLSSIRNPADSRLHPPKAEQTLKTTIAPRIAPAFIPKPSVKAETSKLQAPKIRTFSGLARPTPKHTVSSNELTLPKLSSGTPARSLSLPTAKTSRASAVEGRGKVTNPEKTQSNEPPPSVQQVESGLTRSTSTERPLPALPDPSPVAEIFNDDDIPPNLVKNFHHPQPISARHTPSGSTEDAFISSSRGRTAHERHRSRSTSQTREFKTAEEVPQWPLPTNPADVVISTATAGDEPFESPKLNAPTRRTSTSPSGARRLLDSSGDGQRDYSDPKIIAISGDTSLLGRPTRSTLPSMLRAKKAGFSNPGAAASLKPNAPVRTPPAHLPGRVVVKDSDLETIPESDTASILFRSCTPDDRREDDDTSFVHGDWGTDHARQASDAESDGTEHGTSDDGFNFGHSMPGLGSEPRKAEAILADGFRAYFRLDSKLADINGAAWTFPEPKLVTPSIPAAPSPLKPTQARKHTPRNAFSAPTSPSRSRDLTQSLRACPLSNLKEGESTDTTAASKSHMFSLFPKVRSNTTSTAAMGMLGGRSPVMPGMPNRRHGPSYSFSTTAAKTNNELL